ncbi:MAG: hypothetical protein V3S14_12055, partial [Anaerolineae bacterium]
THHQAAIKKVREGQIVEFVILARHLEDDVCRTSPSAPFKVIITFEPPAPPPRGPVSDVERRQ